MRWHRLIGQQHAVSELKANGLKMINNGIKYSHGLQARGNRGAFLCRLKTKKSLTAGPISLSQGFTLFGITSCLLHEYAFYPYQVETKRQYRGVAVAWYFSPQWL